MGTTAYKHRRLVMVRGTKSFEADAEKNSRNNSSRKTT